MSDTVIGPEGAGIKSVHVIAADAWHSGAFPNNPILFAAWIWVAYSRPEHPTVHDTTDPILVSPRVQDWTFQHPDAFAGKLGQKLNVRFEGRYFTYLPGQPVPHVPSGSSWDKINDTILTADQTRIEFFSGHNPERTVDLQITITWDKPF
jgi:hypothetical protein